MHPDTRERLVGYAWPGNIRELQNVIERAVILAPSAVLEVEPRVLIAAPGTSDAVRTAAAAPARAPGRSDGTADTLDAVEREHIVTTLKRCRWVVDGPDGEARALGLHPSTLRSRMKKLGIRRATDVADGAS